MDKSPWSVPVAVGNIPDSGLHMDIEAPPEARAAVAALAGLRELPALSASFDLSKAGAGVHAVGHVSARVGQTCVVTLEPVENTVEEAVDLRFSPHATPLSAETEAKAVNVDADSLEPLVGGVIDLGAVATESLLLGIDPYPRKPDATFAPPPPADDGPHPFAALEALKKGLPKGEP